MKKHFNCPHCTAAWELPRSPFGGYEREPLQMLATEIAYHLRSEHGDETAALKLERWAISPTPGRSRRQPR